MRVELQHITDENDRRDLDWVKDWPAVPRVGEFIELSDTGDDRPCTGTVRIVMWRDDGVPLVRFR